ncbi:MAG: hypothetical protein NT137_03660 [Methanomassiliicoccales archaeon]|nr:hypothetical protein [Methanomassiliicoccales archaeon]
MVFWNSQDEYKKILELVKNNPDRLADFAFVYYRDLNEGSADLGEWDRLFIAVSKMSCELYRNVTIQEKRAIRKNLSFKGTFVEPSIYEDVKVMANAHEILNEIGMNGGDPSLLELLLVAHDLEFILRPTLLRLNWLVRKTDGEALGYSEAQLNKEKKQRSIRHGIDQIQKKLDLRRKHRVLSKNDKREIRDFVRSMSADKGFPLGVVELRNWIAHRDFFVSGNEVIMNFHPYPGKRKPLTKAQIADIRYTTLGLVTLCMTIDAVFKIASEANLGIMKPQLKIRKKP